MEARRGPQEWLGVCVLAVALAGCARTGGPRSGGPLVVVQTQPVAPMVPGRENGAVAQEEAALMHRFLVTVGPGGALVADAAAEVPALGNGGISRDGLTIRYRLRPGLRFSDGHPLTAADAAATLRALRDPSAILPSRLGLDDVASVQATGPLTLAVHLARPYAPILLYLCGPGNATPILEASQAGVVSQREPDTSAIAGSGPYRARALVPGERLELEPNPYFSPRPRIGALVVRNVGSSETAHVQLRTGEAGAYVLADPALQSQLADIAGLRLQSNPVDGVGSLIFNTQDPVTRDPRVRRAIVDALDVAGDVRRVFHGGVSSRDAPAGLFLWAYDRTAFPPPVRDPRDARALLDASGWRAGRDGKRYRAGVPLELTMIVRGDQPSSSALADTFAQELRAVGVAVNLRQYAVAQFGSPAGPVYQGRFQVAVVQFIAGFDPDLTDQFACDRIPPRGYNKPRYCNPELDRILARAAAVYSQRDRKRFYREAERILARDLPLVPLYRLASLEALPIALRGVAPTPVTPFYGVAGWRLHR